MTVQQNQTDKSGLRERAIKQLQKQRGFLIHVTMYLAINGLLVMIWVMTGSGFFWPVFPIVGWGIGVIANAWDAYGSDVPSETAVRRQMDRMQSRS